jgi:hypothetical protein
MTRCADPSLMLRISAISYTDTRRFSITRATTLCAWSGCGTSAIDITPFLNVLLLSYICCCDKHASSYWTFICRWAWISFTPSLIKKRITEHFFSFVHVHSGAVIFKPALWWHCLFALYGSYRILLIALVICLPTYRSMARYFKFLSQFFGFHLTHSYVCSVKHHEQGHGEQKCSSSSS